MADMTTIWMEYMAKVTQKFFQFSPGMSYGIVDPYIEASILFTKYKKATHAMIFQSFLRKYMRVNDNSMTLKKKGTV